MSIESPSTGRPDWESGPKLKPQEPDKGLSAKIQPQHVGSPGKISPRTVTNIATKSRADKQIQHAVQFIMPKLSERDSFIDNMIHRLSSKILPKAGISIPSISTYPDDATIARLGLDKDDPYIQEKVSLLEVLEKESALSPSRKRLLKEMIRKPEQLLHDLPSLSEVAIGAKSVKLKLQTPIEAVGSLREALKAYIISQNKDLAKTVETDLDELLYATCQTFFTDLVERQVSDDRFKDSSGQDTWAPDAKRIVSSNSFQMEKAHIFKPDTIVMTRTKHFTYIPTGDSEGEKHLTMQVECRYNLKNNKATFTYTYDLDGDKESWNEGS